MTMISFRLEEADAAQAQVWSERLGIDRSELLRQALRRFLERLASENDAEVWERHPPTDEERSLEQSADWGIAEDWSDWADATG